MGNDKIEVIVKGLLESRDYSKLSRKILNKLVKGESIDVLEDSFSESNEKYIFEAVFIICDYANIVLKDGVITNQELLNIKYLKSRLGISEEMLYFFETAERIDKIFEKQFKKIFEDHVIDEDEQIFIEQMQEIFNMPYDDCNEIINRFKK